jgi:hypothetical protein
MENKKYHTIRTVLKIPYCQNSSKIQSQIVGTEAMSKHRSFSWIERDTSIEKKLVLWVCTYDLEMEDT